jgi:hypothetical protein
MVAAPAAGDPAQALARGVRTIYRELINLGAATT